MFSYPKFEVLIERSISIEGLDWPDPSDVEDDCNPCGNLEYMDYTGCSWAEAEEIYEIENGILKRIESAQDFAAELENISDEFYEDDSAIWGLDIGVASTVIALSAARCVPIASCNGGTFGDLHHESHPLVAFYGTDKHVRLLLECSKEADTGLVNSEFGTLTVYSNDIRRLRDFARALIERKNAFDALSVP